MSPGGWQGWLHALVGTEGLLHGWPGRVLGPQLRSPWRKALGCPACLGEGRRKRLGPVTPAPAHSLLQPHWPFLTSSETGFQPPCGRRGSQQGLGAGAGPGPAKDSKQLGAWAPPPDPPRGQWRHKGSDVPEVWQTTQV